jgi:very-short-patch-repair endonuclease
MPDAPHHQIVPPRHRKRARAMRRIATDAERNLWFLLRDRRLGSIKFRRQAPFGRYILDFVCFERRLVVEVDGGQHAESKADKIRDAHLQSHGFRVARYWNTDVLKNPDGVLTDLLAQLDASRPLTHSSVLKVRSRPLPQGATAFADLIRCCCVLTLGVKSPGGRILGFPEGLRLGFTAANHGWGQE